MKTSKKILCMALGVFAMVSCQNDEKNLPALPQGDTAPVSFELDARVMSQAMQGKQRVYSPTYTLGGFSVYAFKKQLNGTDFVFEKAINVSNFNYSNYKLTGTENLTIGTYKFVPAYGIANQLTTVQNGVLTIPPLNNTTVLTNSLDITYNAAAPITSEIFLQTSEDVSSLPEYRLGLDATNTTVAATIKRAVGRVDLMFISADKVGNTYQEKAYTDYADIFGGRTVESIKLDFTGLNNMMNLFGGNLTQSRSSLQIPLGNFNNTIVIGNGTATTVGDNGYANYDNMQASDIIQGAAHVFGTYLFPNSNNEKNLGLQVKVKLSGVEERTIPIEALPIEQNKVTVVKIYVLNGNNVGTTTTEFEFELDKTWLDANEVEGEIK